MTIKTTIRINEELFNTYERMLAANKDDELRKFLSWMRIVAKKSLLEHLNVVSENFGILLMKKRILRKQSTPCWEEELSSVFLWHGIALL